MVFPGDLQPCSADSGLAVDDKVTPKRRRRMEKIANRQRNSGRFEFRRSGREVLRERLRNFLEFQKRRVFADRQIKIRQIDS
jgi:hypothetical protein